MQFGSAADLEKYLLTLAQTPYKEEKSAGREEKEEKAMTDYLAYKTEERERSERLQLFQDILKRAKRDSAIAPATMCDIEGSLEVPRIDCPDHNQQTPLMHAVMIKSIGYVRALLKQKANPNIKDKHGRNALHLAVQTVGNPVVSLLLDSDIEIDATDSKGETALMRACENNDIATIKLLLAKNANVNFTNDSGNSALRIALSNKFIEVAKLLLDKQARLDNTLEVVYPSGIGEKIVIYTSTLQITVLLFSYKLQLKKPEIFQETFERIERHISASIKSSWSFCLAEAIRQKPPKDDHERTRMLSLYQCAMDGESFIPAAAGRLGDFALEKGNYLEALSLYIQAMTGAKQPGITQYLQSLTAGQSSSSKPAHMPLAVAALDNNDFASDPFAWQNFIKCIHILEAPEFPEQHDEKSAALTPQTAPLIKIGGSGGPVPETKKHTAARQLSLPKEFLTLAHNILIRIPISAICRLTELSADQWEYLLMTIKNNSDKFSDPKDCGRLVMQLALRCYETLPDAPKDKLAEIANLLKKLEEFSPPADEKSGSCIATSHVSGLDDEEDEKSYSVTSSIFNCYKMGMLFDKAISLFLIVADVATQANAWMELRRLIPQPVAEPQLKEGDLLYKLQITRNKKDVFTIPASQRLDAFLLLLTTLPQKQQYNFIINILLKQFRSIAKMADDAILSATACQAHVLELDQTAKEKYRAKVKSEYARIYIEMIDKDDYSSILKDKNTAFVTREVFSSEPPELLAFLKVVDPRPEVTSEPEDSDSDLPKDISQRLVVTKFPQASIVKIIFHVLTARRNDRDETAGEQKQLILELLPEITINPPHARLLQASKAVLGDVVFKELHANVLNIANVDSMDANGRTPLMLAASYGLLGFARGLLARKADINIKDRTGRTALGYAILVPQNPVAILLIKTGCEINVADPEGYSPLIRAVLNNDLALTELLLTSKADIDFADSSGNTALHHAAYNGLKDMVELLLRHKTKITVNRQNNKGDTALMLAAGRGHLEVAELLLHQQANPNIENNQEETALQHAAKEGLFEMGSLLIKNFASPFFKNRNALCVVFSYDSLEYCDYSEEKFVNATFLNRCKNIADRLKLAALFLIYDVPLPASKKLYALLNEISPGTATDEWNFCCAEALYADHKNAVDIIQTKMQIKKYYNDILVLPYAQRRLASVAVVEDQFEEALALFTKAIVAQVPYTWVSILDASYKLQSHKDRLKSQSIQNRIDTLLLEISPVELSYRKHYLTAEGWDYLASTLKTRIEQGNITNIDNVAVMMYAVLQSAEAQQQTAKDEANFVCKGYEEVLALETTEQQTSAANEQVLQKNFAILLSILTSEEQNLIQAFRPSESKRDASLKVLEPVSPQKELPLLQQFANLSFDQKISFIKNALLACFVTRCLQADPDFNTERTLLIFKQLLKVPADKQKSVNLRQILQVFALSKKELYLQGTIEHVRLFQDIVKQQQVPEKLSVFPWVAQIYEVINTVESLQGVQTKESKQVMDPAKNFEHYLIYFFPQLGVDLSLIRDVSGTTLLIRAVRANNPIYLKFLLKLKLPPDERDSQGTPPLYFAVLNKNSQFVQWLLSANATVSPSYLRGAAGNGDVESLEFLLAHNVNLNDQNIHGVTALINATRHGHISCVELLVKKGADVDLADDKRRTALHHAARLRRYDIVSKLVLAGANVHYVSRSGDGVLHWLFAYQLPKDEYTTYVVNEYDHSKFLKKCKDIDATLNCVVLFLSFNVTIDKPDSFRKLMQALEKLTKDRSAWCFCMGETLRQSGKEKEAQKYYAEAKLPAAIRRRGEFSLQQNSYSEARDLFKQAFSQGDQLALECVIKLAHRQEQYAEMKLESTILTFLHSDRIKTKQALAALGDLKPFIIGMVTRQHIVLFKQLTVDEWSFLARNILRLSYDADDRMEPAHLLRLILEKLPVPQPTSSSESMALVQTEIGKFCFMAERDLNEKTRAIGEFFQPAPQQAIDRVTSLITQYYTEEFTPEQLDAITKICRY